MRAHWVVLGVLAFILVSGCTAPSSESFVSSYPDVQPSQIQFLADGETFSLTAAPVRLELGTSKGIGYAYNNTLPSPILKVKQNASATIEFTNNLPEPTTVHWHGLRVENAQDGVPLTPQDEVQPGETHTYQLIFPDAGFYWYHPHIREDRQQDAGMYGMILVEPQVPLPTMQEEIWALDDVQASTSIQLAGNETTHALMGRYGNQLLVNGDADKVLEVQSGEWVRFYLVNVSNARPMRWLVENHSLQVRALDGGFLPSPVETDALVLAPSERGVVEVQFTQPGTYTIWNHTPLSKKVFARVEVKGTPTQASLEAWSPRTEDLPPVEMLQALRERAPDMEYEIALHWEAMEAMMGGEHGGHMMHGGGGVGGIEWEDTMPGMNASMTPEDVTWVLRDVESGAENMNIHREVELDSWKVMRIHNPEGGLHPMQHPIHLHGQRFVVLSVNGKPVENQGWKDTVLVPAGSTFDLAVEFSNPGEWMLHCHTAEHLEAGMMTHILVG